MKYITSAEEIQYFENEWDKIRDQVILDFGYDVDLSEDELDKETNYKFESKFGFDYNELND